MTLSLEDVVQPDQVVGGYRIEKKLGAGGFGHVYLAHRDGVACALKFIHPGRVGDWGWRELYIMQRHEFPHVVRLLGHFKWPEEKPEYLVLVMLAPANVRYRSPESVAFFLRTDRAPGERYPYAVTDETYALGVLLYVLLTDQYPFGGPEEELLVEIMTSAPKAPSERNSRVPPALDGLCLRLLAKEPHVRVPNAESLCAQLVALLEKAKGDARWDVPLCYGWTADGRTTEAAPEVVGPQAKVWMQRWLRRKPRRGPRPPKPMWNLHPSRCRAGTSTGPAAA